MKFVTFGEIMLRLAPEGYLRLLQEPRFEATFGGGEANVAVSLANFGDDAQFVTRLPENDIAEAAIRELRGFGVGVDNISRGGDRMGIYYCEKGASMRPSKVIYDRAGSSIATAASEDFDWEKIFKGVDGFHFTGITPALGKNVAQITLQAAKAAKESGITVSCDLNYRKKLWDKKTARDTMTALMPYVDILIANEEDAFDVFNISAGNSDVLSGKLDEAGYESVAKQLVDRFGFRAVAITLRQSISANDNVWGAMIYADKKAYFSKKYDVRIVDRVGGGDSFAAGLLHALGQGRKYAEALEFAVAASALKHSVEGDFNRVNEGEVEALMRGNASGRVQR